MSPVACQAGWTCRLTLQVKQKVEAGRREVVEVRRVVKDGVDRRVRHDG